MSPQAPVSAGYLVTRWIARPEYLDEVRFPGRMISASDFVAPVLPAVPAGWLEAADMPHGRFSGYADAAQGKLLWALSADLERIGLDSALSVSLAELLAAATAHGDFVAPSAFTSLEAVRRLVRHVGSPPDTVVIGLALPPEHVEAAAASDGGLSGFTRLPSVGAEPAEGGCLLGWDVYRPFGGELHPWVHERDRLEALQSCATTTNAHGLFAAAADAECVAARLTADAAAEGAWFPWRLTAYPVTAAAPVPAA